MWKLIGFAIVLLMSSPTLAQQQGAAVSDIDDWKECKPADGERLLRCLKDHEYHWRVERRGTSVEVHEHLGPPYASMGFDQFIPLEIDGVRLGLGTDGLERHVRVRENEKIREIPAYAIDLEIDEGFFLAFDRGEFGGWIWFFPRDLSPGYQVLRGYSGVRTILELSDRIIAVAGFDHLGANWGAILELLRAANGRWALSRKIELPGQGMAAHAIDGSSCYVATREQLLHYTVDAGVEVVADLPFRLVPNSVVRDRFGDVLIGARHVVIKLSGLDKAGGPRTSMLVPDYGFVYRVHRDCDIEIDCQPESSIGSLPASFGSWKEHGFPHWAWRLLCCAVMVACVFALWLWSRYRAAR